MILQDMLVNAPPRVGSIRDAEGRLEAVRLIKEGYPVGSFVHATCGIWVDADNPDAVEAILRIKGEKRTGKPLSMLLFADMLVPMIDLDRIRPDLRPIFGDAEELAARLSMLCFMRLPVKESVARSLPDVVVSQTPDGTRWIQCCVPGKRRSDFPLLAVMLKAGVRVPSATSMNVSGQPEIVDQLEGVDFCEAHDIPFFLADPGAKAIAKGSYPIISVGPEGVRLLRQGHFPDYLFRYLLQTDVDTSQARPAKYPVYLTHCEICASRTGPHKLHDEILATLEGADLP